MQSAQASGAIPHHPLPAGQSSLVSPMHAMHPMAAAANTPGSNLNSPMIGMVNAGLEGSVMGASLAGRGRGRGRGGGTRGKLLGVFISLFS